MEAIRAVLAGKVYVSGNFTESMLERIAAGNSGEKSPIQYLSNRELQAFELMGHGMTTDAIASKMHVSPKTVETYRIRIKHKLGIKKAAELIQRAAQWVLEVQSGGVSDGYQERSATT